MSSVWSIVPFMALEIPVFLNDFQIISLNKTGSLTLSGFKIIARYDCRLILSLFSIIKTIRSTCRLDKIHALLTIIKFRRCWLRDQKGKSRNNNCSAAHLKVNIFAAPTKCDYSRQRKTNNATSHCRLTLSLFSTIKTI